MKSIRNTDPNTSPCTWSARLRHPQIELSGLQARRCLNPISCDAIVLGTTALLPGNTHPYKWAINIIQCGIWTIYTGIALEKNIS